MKLLLNFRDFWVTVSNRIEKEKKERRTEEKITQKEVRSHFCFFVFFFG